MKKKIAFVCVSAMLLAMLGGCKGDGPVASTPEENAAVSSSSTTTTTATTAEDATTTTTTTTAAIKLPTTTSTTTTTSIPSITTTACTTWPTGFNSTTAAPDSDQYTEKIVNSAAEKEEISIFYLDEQHFDNLVHDTKTTAFVYTKKSTYPQDGDLFYCGLVSPFRVNQQLIDFVGSPAAIENYLRKNDVDAEVKYTALIYTQFVSVTLYVRTADAVYFIAVDDCAPSTGYDSADYTYEYVLYEPIAYASYVKESREEHTKWMRTTKP